MNIQKFINKESLTSVAFATGGALSTVPIKKFITSKIPVINKKEVYQDGFGVLLGIGIAAFSGKKNVKLFGMGMSAVSGFNLLRSGMTKVGLGRMGYGGSPVMMQGQGLNPPGGGSENVMMGADTNSAGGNNYQAGDAGDWGQSFSGEMNF